ncbi:DUF1735 domain-containing protein [Pedobacter sp. SD-b]|uniref:DUF1735 domain-containing protein n=1 Tax=Pedobacter segetis TaxID=2793069 RepID=A0ABS1BML2_9SPHI|nr:DUF1735 domain-containing protein [Pedobacter segetis]MBK0384138.1 DUF1735 domain-containing protein [Pedobacter segetis]
MMKIRFNLLGSLFILIVLAAFTSCEKSISEEKIGIEKVYIPESISVNTTDNNYSVPSKVNDKVVYGPAQNFLDDDANNKVLVYLGVSKSGKETTESFSVDLMSRPDTINQLITTNGATFLQLPETAYTLPASVTLASGEATTSFNLVIDKPMLKTYAGKKVAVCVALSNPTRYMLNSRASKVIIIIDVDALKLK